MVRSYEGYSWLSNQHGLAIDNVLAYELVIPNGKVTNVTVSTDPDLFFSLKVREPPSSILLSLTFLLG